MALAAIMVVAIVLGAVSWSMIPESKTRTVDSVPPAEEEVETPVVMPDVEENITVPEETSDFADGSPIDSEASVPVGSPSSIIKWTDGKLGSELTSEGAGQWNEEIDSTMNIKIGYNRLAWDNVFYDNLYGSGNMKLQVTMAYTDGGGWDCQRNADGIGYHGTWAPTTTTWVISSDTWTPRWKIGVTHSYSPDYAQQGSVTDITTLHYKTYE